ncbi:MAG TPA: hypothetical protein VGI65_13170 [Steroidobacteraceae bacterium]
MRGMLLLTVLLLTACASQPKAPSVIVADAVPASESYTLEQRLAYAKKMHLKLITQDGQDVFCLNEPLTGTHMVTQPRCYTARQLDDMQHETERDARYLFRPVTPPPIKGN